MIPKMPVRCVRGCWLKRKAVSRKVAVRFDDEQRRVYVRLRILKGAVNHRL